MPLQMKIIPEFVQRITLQKVLLVNIKRQWTYDETAK